MLVGIPLMHGILSSNRLALFLDSISWPHADKGGGMQKLSDFLIFSKARDHRKHVYSSSSVYSISTRTYNTLSSLSTI